MSKVYKTKQKWSFEHLQGSRSGPLSKACTSLQIIDCNINCIHTKKLSCLKSGAEFDMNDSLYEFKNLHHFKDSLTFGVKAVIDKTLFI